MKTFLIFLWKCRRLIARYLGIQMGLSATAGVLDPIERSDRDGSSINVRKSVSVIFRTLIREWKVTLETFQRWCKCILTPGVSLRQHHHFHFSVSTGNFFWNHISSWNTSNQWILPFVLVLEIEVEKNSFNFGSRSFFWLAQNEEKEKQSEGKEGSNSRNISVYFVFQNSSVENSQ